MWNAESEKVRADFKAQAEKLRKEHLVKHPNYTYKPRKPSEKKKRMTKKKAAALAEQEAAEKAAAEKAAAENRALSLELVNQYAAQQLFSEYEEVDDLLTLPLPSAEVLAQQVQVDPADITLNTAELGFNLTPHPAYLAAQEDDMGFFPDIVDDHDPAFLAIVAEVGEAFEAGYYDDEVTAAPSADPIPSYPADYNYELTDYYD